MKHRWALATLLLAAASTGFAQFEGNRANWGLQERYSSSALRKFVYSSTVRPNWINESDKFWYIWNESAGRRFMYVDPKDRNKTRAFDHNKLAGALSELGKKPYIGKQLPFTTIKYNEEETSITFTVNRVEYEWDLKGESLKIAEKEEEDETTTAPRPPGRGGQRGQGGRGNRPTFSTAPDKLTFAYLQGYNLYIGEKEEEKDEADKIEATQLTKDGVQFFTFRSSNYGTYTLGDEQKRKSSVGVNWSKDSEAFSVVRSDAREVKDLWLVNSLSMPRPTLETYKYQMPGEAEYQQSELFVYTKDGGELVKIPGEIYTDQSYMNIHWTGEDHDELRFVRRDRLQRNLEYCEYNLESGEITVLLTEAVEDAHLERNGARYIGEDSTGDFIWWSERTGWGHFYLYSHDGELKNAITSGPWRAERLMEIDEDQKRIWISAVGYQPDENIYNQHYYSVGFDGKGMRHLTEGDANHTLSLSESKSFGVDGYSRVDMKPASVVRDDRGRVHMELETMDLSKLDEAGWKMPERFVVKSADGTTDIYGNMWKPFNFSPHKSYPIILHIYPGPQTESVTNSFSATASDQELAQLGFIVIQIGNRGGTPHRDNAYHSYGYYNLRDYGLADKKAGVEELARKYSWIDIDNVGIFGHSGGGFMTAAALLMKPYNDFFTVGVSSSGNHDNNVYNSNWSEQHHGLKVAEKEEKKEGEEDEEEDEDEKEVEKDKFEIKVPTNAELAANLNGKLFLVHGDMDNNVHPAGTIRLIDALIKANKRFEYMTIPGARHGYGAKSGYFRQLLYEYFARHLIGDTYDRSAQLSDKGK